MIVQIILITLGFVVGLSYPTGIEPLWSLPVDLPNTLMSASAILLLSILYILIGIRLVGRQMAPKRHGDKGAIRNNLNNYYRQLFNYRLLLLAVYFAQIYICHLPILITGPTGFIGLGIGQIPFVTNFLILTPFFLTLILSYIPFYKVEQFIYKQQSDKKADNTSYARAVIPAASCHSRPAPSVIPATPNGVLINKSPVGKAGIQYGGINSSGNPEIKNLIPCPVRDSEPSGSGLRTCQAQNDKRGGNDVEDEHSKFPSLSNFLAFQIRTYFMLAVLPLLVFIFVFDVIHAIRPLRDMVITYPFAEWLASILLLMAMYILMPFVLKYIWVTKPLPDGPLRIYLNAIAYRANIKIRDFLIWEVGPRPFVNALLIGLFPFNRFVIFTDSLIKNLSDDEIAAVFSHEVGHGKFNHLLILLLFTMAYLSILFSLSGVIDSALGTGIWNFGFSLTLMLFFWLFLFGQLSRRFELQADWFAAQITADPDSFTRALTRIAYLNGIPMKTSGISSLTHPSIDKRISSIANRTDFASAQLKTMKKILLILAVSCALGIAGLSYSIVNELNSAPQRQLRTQAFEMTRKAYSLLAECEKGTDPTVQMEKLKMSIFYIDTAIASDPQRSLNYIIKGDALEYLGPNYHKQSQLNYRKAYELEPTDPGERYYLSKKLLGE